jgi:hypothetical protein
VFSTKGPLVLTCVEQGGYNERCIMGRFIYYGLISGEMRKVTCPGLVRRVISGWCAKSSWVCAPRRNAASAAAGSALLPT